MGQAPTAVVCTRNRPGPLLETIRALLQDEDEQLELIVIDQSDGDESFRALQPFHHDPRLRYHRSVKRGKGAGLNEALHLARGDILVCTDDDCQPSAGWVTGMAATLETRPGAAITFCRVDPVPYDRSAGYVPAYEIRSSRSLRSVNDIRGGLGIGAGMAVRRTFVASMGGFDESFGPGARFPSADEWDIALRALLTGHDVFETARLSVVHDGFRSFADGKAHARRDWLALGAVSAKPLRAGLWRASGLAAWLFSTKALWPPMADLLAFRRPRGLGRIAAFLQGFISGFATPVERDTLRFLVKR